MLVSPSGGRYIGMTTRSMRRRFWRHVAAANAGEPTRIAQAFRKYGKENIEAVPLIICADLEALKIMEECAIRVFGTIEGRNYNIRKGWNDGPDTTGYRHTKEARQRIAVAQTGRVRSVETRARMAAANLGKVLSPEHCVKIALARTGTKASPETRAKMSAALTGRAVSLDTRTKISAANRGKILSSEHRAKLSTARKKKVIVGDKVYSSYTEAADQHGVSQSCVGRRIRNKNFKDWHYGA